MYLNKLSFSKEKMIASRYLSILSYMQNSFKSYIFHTAQYIICKEIRGLK